VGFSPPDVWLDFASGNVGQNTPPSGVFVCISEQSYLLILVCNQRYKSTGGFMEYQRDEHRVHLIVYHLIWTPKRRKPVLRDAVASDCRELITQKCQQKGWEILELAIQPEHIHLFVRVFPTVSAADVVKECKGVTSRTLRKKHPHLLKLPSMWTRSYFASTAGKVSAETIKRYVEAQKGL
jgi:putative transposase